MDGDRVTSCVERSFHELLLYSSNNPLFHPPEISAPILGTKHFCSSPEVPDSQALPKQQGWEVRAVTSLLQARGHAGEDEVSVSSLPHPHWHPGCSNHCCCSCRVLQCGHGLRKGSPTEALRKAQGWLLIPQLRSCQEIPQEEMREHSPVEQFQELTN